MNLENLKLARSIKTEKDLENLKADLLFDYAALALQVLKNENEDLYDTVFNSTGDNSLVWLALHILESYGAPIASGQTGAEEMKDWYFAPNYDYLQNNGELIDAAYEGTCALYKLQDGSRYVVLTDNSVISYDADQEFDPIF